LDSQIKRWETDQPFVTDPYAKSAAALVTTTYIFTNSSTGSVLLEEYKISCSRLKPITSTIDAANAILNYFTTEELINVTGWGRRMCIARRRRNPGGDGKGAVDAHEILGRLSGPQNVPRSFQ
jgi:hypothetical protein